MQGMWDEWGNEKFIYKFGLKTWEDENTLGFPSIYWRILLKLILRETSRTVEN
jgi:hypothetical protein